VQNTILVVDNDTSMQLLLLRLFAEGGYAVASAGDGGEAIARIEADCPGLIVANVDLPGRSGVEVCRYAKERPVPVPVILLAPGTEPAPIEPADLVLGIPIDTQRTLEAAHQLLERSAASQSPPPTKLLVIDDDPGILSLLESLLTKEGYAVVTADNGREGLAALERGRPDLILLDVQMPGMSGFEVLSKIRERDTDTPIIMVTGYGSEDVATQSMRLGADDYLAKPLRVRNICFRIQSNLERARLRASQEQLNRRLRQATLELAERLQAAHQASLAFQELVARVLGHLRDLLARANADAATVALAERLRAAADSKDPMASLEAVAREIGAASQG